MVRSLPPGSSLLLACMAFASAEYIYMRGPTTTTGRWRRLGHEFEALRRGRIGTSSKRTAGAATRAALTVAYLLTGDCS